MSGTENKKVPNLSVAFTKPFGTSEAVMRAGFADGASVFHCTKGRDDIVTAIARYIGIEFTKDDKIGVVVSASKSVDFWLDFYKHDDRVSKSSAVFLYDDLDEALQYGSEIVIDALEHCFPDIKVCRCNNVATAVTGARGVFFYSTAPEDEEEPSNTQAEIDRLRERIRFLEQDVETVEKVVFDLANRVTGEGVYADNREMDAAITAEDLKHGIEEAGQLFSALGATLRKALFHPDGRPINIWEEIAKSLAKSR